MPPATRRRAQPQPSPPHHFIDPASDSDESDDEGVDDEELIEDVEGEDEEEDEEEEEPLGRWAPLVPLVAETLICHFPHPHMTKIAPLSLYSAFCVCVMPIYVSYYYVNISISTFGVAAENSVDHRGLGLLWLLPKHHTYISMSYSSHMYLTP